MSGSNFSRGFFAPSETEAAGDIHSAASSGDTSLIKRILSEEEDGESLVLRCENRNGYPPLHVAVKNGQREAARLLLKRGPDEYGQTATAYKTPLHVAAETGNMFFFSFLNTGQKKLAVKARDLYGYTPLHTAVQKEDLSSVEKLLDGGADVEAKDKYGRSVLFFAITKGNQRIVHKLLSQKADVYTLDRKRNTVFHVADSGRLYRRLSRHYIDFWQEDNHHTNRSGQTPLQLAAKRGDCWMVADMCTRGADPNQRDDGNHTALDFVMQGKHQDVVQCLKQHAKKQEDSPRQYYFKRKRI